MRAVLALSILSATTFAVLPAQAQATGGDAAVLATEAISPAAISRLADRLARLEEDGLDPAWYNIPAAELATSDPARYRAETMRAVALRAILGEQAIGPRRRLRPSGLGKSSKSKHGKGDEAHGQSPRIRRPDDAP